MREFGLYLLAYSPKVWTLVTAGALFGVDKVVLNYWPWGAKQLDRIPAIWRIRIELSLLFVAFFYAGFLVWRDEHTLRVAEHPPQTNVTYWEPLTSDEVSSLEAKLSKIKPEPVVIACETPNCKDLAESFGTAFRRAYWQDVKFIFHGGLGITGAYGIAINPGDEQTTAIIEAIETATTLRVQQPSYTRNQVKVEPGIFFVIGAKPF